MAELTIKSIEQLEQIVLDYLQGSDPDEIRVRLTNVCTRSNTSCKKLYQSIPLDVPIHIDDEEDEGDYIHEENKILVAILASLNIRKKTTETDGPYEKLFAKSHNLHELLKNLSHDGHHHVGNLLNLIESTKPRSNSMLTYLLGAVTSAGLGAFVHFNRQYITLIGQWFSTTFPRVMTWLGRTFSILRNIPLLGIIINGIILTWNWYSTFTNGTTTTPKKLQELFFKTITSGLTISAYAMAFLAGGIITTPAALLFIASSLTKVIKGAYEWWKNAKPQEPGDVTAWEVQAEYERAENLHQRSKKTAWVKIVAAICTTIAVAVWDFFPPDLLFTAACVAFISMTALFESSAISSFNEAAADDLQNAIENINVPRSTELRPGNQADAAKVKEQFQLVREKKRQFNAEVVKERQLLNQAALDVGIQKSNLDLREQEFRQIVHDFTSEARDNVTSAGKILSRLNKLSSGQASANPQLHRGAPANDQDEPIPHHQALFQPVPPPADLDASHSPDASLADNYSPN